MSWISLLGWSGQGLYFSRSLLQWLASERAGRSLVPPRFWAISVAAAVLLLAYAALRGDSVIVLGQVVNLMIYLRNIRLANRPPLIPLRRRVLGLFAAALAVCVGSIAFHDLGDVHNAVLAAGWVGQALFLARFPVQWWHAERSGRAELPLVFWWLSLAGAALILVYAAARQDWPIASGQAVGLLAYLRNLHLARPRTDVA